MNHGHSRPWGFAERCSKVASPSACTGDQDTKAKETDDQGRDSHRSALPCTSMMTLGTDLGGGKEVGKLEAFLKKERKKNLCEDGRGFQKSCAEPCCLDCDSGRQGRQSSPVYL